MNDNEKKEINEKELDNVSGGYNNPLAIGPFVWKTCKSCGSEYSTIKTDFIRICPECKKNSDNKKIL